MRRDAPTAWLAVAVVAHLVVLYWPRPPDVGGGVPHLDLVVHLVVFGAVALCAVRCGLPLRWVVLALLAHAVVSEVVQDAFVPDRTGDWRDAVADAAGTLAGALLGRRWVRRVAARPAPDAARAR
ncbi:hypothetical protein GCM10028777_04580 [Angustibacter speluncae]